MEQFLNYINWLHYYALAQEKASNEQIIAKLI